MRSAKPVSAESAETCSVENSIICMSSPWLELNPVRSTKHSAPPSGVAMLCPARLDCDLVAAVTGVPGDATTTVVPEKSVWTRSRPSISSGRCSSSSPSSTLRASFICGTDSPVSVASLTTAEPLNTSRSHGTTSLPGGGGGLFFFPSVESAAPFSFLTTASPAFFSGTLRVSEMRSPGTRSVVVSWCHLASRYTIRGVGLEAMLPRVLKVRSRWKAVVASSMKIEKRVKIVYCQYSSSIHRMAQKSWKMAMGARSWLLKRSRNLGGGMRISFFPNISSLASIPSLRMPQARAYRPTALSVSCTTSLTAPMLVLPSLVCVSTSSSLSMALV
mmetsp:Transcript_25973/g.60814  ORF Transcript_25973/g.60814 Transcript_25973/m.60814 type:complete len:331 (-) Transcript_25973:942-1934(-)